MSACDELESMILDRAAGALKPDESAALDAHLTGCARCRAWLSSCEEAIKLASLPAPSEVESRLFAQLPTRARAAFRGRQQQGSPWGRPLVSLAVGAAAAAAVLVVGVPRWQLAGRDGGVATRAVLSEEGSELEAWALADPLEDQALEISPDEGADDGSMEAESMESDEDIEQEWEDAE